MYTYKTGILRIYITFVKYKVYNNKSHNFHQKYTLLGPCFKSDQWPAAWQTHKSVTTNLTIFIFFKFIVTNVAQPQQLAAYKKVLKIYFYIVDIILKGIITEMKMTMMSEQ